MDQVKPLNSTMIADFFERVKSARFTPGKEFKQVLSQTEFAKNGS